MGGQRRKRAGFDVSFHRASNASMSRLALSRRPGAVQDWALLGGGVGELYVVYAGMYLDAF